jgi:hypothetical protein
MDEEIDIFQWPKEGIGAKMSKLEESFHCEICFGIFGKSEI